MTVAERLAGVPLFAALSSDELQELAAAMTEQTLAAGTKVISEGTRGARIVAFFVIEEGTAIVSKEGRELSRLGPGEHFGEIALLRDTPRTATVTAETDLRCLVTSAWEFRSRVERSPALAWRLLESVAQRLEKQEL
jgi:CRP-like cAMP-binding protein